MRRSECNTEAWSGESGQAVVLVVIILGLFLLGVVGFAVDLTNIWFHRQAAAAAADAACQAGAMDMLATSGGLTPPAAGFTAGPAGDCASSPSATMCTYAKYNGYSGTGLSANSASNSVSWSFPPSVAGVTGAVNTNAFLKVLISENVTTYFMRFMTRKTIQNINVSATCGVAAVKDAAPMLVLHPTLSGAFNYSGGGELIVVGGPQRSLQVNSSSSTGIKWAASGLIDLSNGGPHQTGADIGVVGGPTTIPTNGSSVGYKGGTTGSWKSDVIPVPDPYGSVAAPASIKLITPSTTTSGTKVAYGTNGCPDHANGCLEFAPGYYPSGITLSGTTTAIFDPGIYYMGGSLSAGNSATVRVSKPGGTRAQTAGVMFYFSSGSIAFSGCSGCTNANIEPVSALELTCDGTSPPSALGMSSSINGNVLFGQCTSNATYWDAGGDTTDSLSSTGSRGLLIFQSHTDTTQPSFSGSGALTFSGALYFHNTSYTDVLSLSGGSSSGTFVLGEIIADQVNLSGSGIIKLALTPAKTTNLAKVGLFQ